MNYELKIKKSTKIKNYDYVKNYLTFDINYRYNINAN